MWFSTRCSNRILSAKEKSTIYENNKLDYVCIKSRVVTGLLTGHNTVRRHLYLLGLTDSPLCRGCGMKEETLAHIVCEREVLASLRHTHLDSFFLEPEDFKSMNIGAIWSFGKATGLLWFWYGAQRPVNKGLGASGPWGPVPTCSSFIHSYADRRKDGRTWRSYSGFFQGRI